MLLSTVIQRKSIVSAYWLGNGLRTGGKHTLGLLLSFLWIMER
jgi:hypothetical protein